MQSNPSKGPNFNMGWKSEKPASFNKSIFPLVEKGSRTPLKDIYFS